MNSRRIVFSKGNQRAMLSAFVSHHNKTQVAAAKQLGVARYSFRNWIREKRTLPENIFNKILRICPELKKFSAHIDEVRDANWGRRRGGQACYRVLRKKYGDSELAKRKIAGGKKSIKLRLMIIEGKMPSADAPQVLELLGALIGDGWIGISGGRKQVCYCGNIKQMAYAKHLQKLLTEAFGIRGYLKMRERYSVFYIIINSGPMFDFFQKRFDFPKGLKAKFNTDMLPKGWNNAVNVIRGVFDTDGGIYFDKAKNYARPYPVIDITSHNPELLDWISEKLAEKSFKVIRLKYSIRLKAISQVERWFNEIKPSNRNHTLKWNRWKTKFGPVSENALFSREAQLG